MPKKWTEVEANPEFQSYSPEEKADTQRQYFESVMRPQLSGEDIQPTMNGFFSKYDYGNQANDTGQGYVSSLFGSAGRGLGTTISAPIEGLGAVASVFPGVDDDNALRRAGQSVQDYVEDISPVNPAYQEDLGVQTFGAVGNAAGMLGAGLLTGGAADLALGTRALTGAEAALAASRAAGVSSNAILGQAGLMGSAQGADLADQYGVTDPLKRAGLILGGGATEVLTEGASAFGTKKFASNLLGHAENYLENRALAAGKDVLGESLEEVGSGAINDLSVKAVVEEDPKNPGYAVNGQKLPPAFFSLENLESLGTQGLMGAVGGTVFVGAKTLAENRGARQGMQIRKAAQDRITELESAEIKTPEEEAELEELKSKDIDLTAHLIKKGVPAEAQDEMLGAANAFDLAMKQAERVNTAADKVLADQEGIIAVTEPAIQAAEANPDLPNFSAAAREGQAVLLELPVEEAVSELDAQDQIDAKINDLREQGERLKAGAEAIRQEGLKSRTEAPVEQPPLSPPSESVTTPETPVETLDNAPQEFPVKKVYHGSKDKNITKWSANRTQDGGGGGMGIYFGKGFGSGYTGEEGRNYEADLNLQNPYRGSDSHTNPRVNDPEVFNSVLDGLAKDNSLSESDKQELKDAFPTTINFIIRPNELSLGLTELAKRNPKFKPIADAYSKLDNEGILRNFNKWTGYDGVAYDEKSPNRTGRPSSYHDVYVAWFPEQIKTTQNEPSESLPEPAKGTQANAPSGEIQGVASDGILPSQRTESPVTDQVVKESLTPAETPSPEDSSVVQPPVTEQPREIAPKEEAQKPKSKAVQLVEFHEGVLNKAKAELAEAEQKQQEAKGKAGEGNFGKQLSDSYNIRISNLKAQIKKSESALKSAQRQVKQTPELATDDNKNTTTSKPFGTTVSFTPVDTPLEATPAIVKAESSLSNAGKPTTLRVVEPTRGRDRNRLLSDFVSAFTEATGSPVYFVDSDGEMPFSGMNVPADNGKHTILLHVKSKRMVEALLGHEWGHSLKRNRPALYAQLQKHLLSALPEKVSSKEAARLAQYYKEGKIPDEITNNLIGDVFTDPEFWRKLSLKDANLATKLYENFKKWLESLIQKVRGSEFGLSETVKNYEKVRDSVVKAFEESTRISKADSSSYMRTVPVSGGPEENAGEGRPSSVGRVNIVDSMESDVEDFKKSYGAWIDRQGNMTPVTITDGHETFAAQQLGRTDRNAKQFATRDLMNKGWVRVYNGDSEINFETGKEQTASPAQMKLLKRLSDDLKDGGVPLYQDTAKGMRHIYGPDSELSNSERVSKVTPEQDAAYMKAVESGDTETAQKMVDEAAKKAGYNVGPVWHGTSHKFNSFELNDDRARDSGFLGRGFYFTTKGPDFAKSFGPRVISARLSAENIFDVNTASIDEVINLINASRKSKGLAPLAESKETVLRDDWKALTTRDDWIQFDGPSPIKREVFLKNQGDPVVMAVAAGYDAVKGASEGAIVVPNAAQIKSADPVTRDSEGNIIPLSERFNEESDDIRYSLGESEEENVLEHRVNSAIKEIKEDMASGVVPETVKDFSELHDYVDANEYINDAEREDRMIGPLGKSKGWKPQDYADFSNRIIEGVNGWLESRDQIPELSLGEDTRTPEERLQSISDWFAEDQRQVGPEGVDKNAPSQGRTYKSDGTPVVGKKVTHSTPERQVKTAQAAEDASTSYGGFTPAFGKALYNYIEDGTPLARGLSTTDPGLKLSFVEWLELHPDIRAQMRLDMADINPLRGNLGTQVGRALQSFNGIYQPLREIQNKADTETEKSAETHGIKFRDLTKDILDETEADLKDIAEELTTEAAKTDMMEDITDVHDSLYGEEDSAPIVSFSDWVISGEESEGVGSFDDLVLQNVNPNGFNRDAFKTSLQSKFEDVPDDVIQGVTDRIADVLDGMPQTEEEDRPTPNYDARAKRVVATAVAKDSMSKAEPYKDAMTELVKKRLNETVEPKAFKKALDDLGVEAETAYALDRKIQQDIDRRKAAKEQRDKKALEDKYANQAARDINSLAEQFSDTPKFNSKSVSELTELKNKLQNENISRAEFVKGAERLNVPSLLAEQMADLVLEARRRASVVSEARKREAELAKPEKTVTSNINALAKELSDTLPKSGAAKTEMQKLMESYKGNHETRASLLKKGVALGATEASLNKWAALVDENTKRAETIEKVKKQAAEDEKYQKEAEKKIDKLASELSDTLPYDAKKSASDLTRIAESYAKGTRTRAELVEDASKLNVNETTANNLADLIDANNNRIKGLKRGEKEKSVDDFAKRLVSQLNSTANKKSTTTPAVKRITSAFKEGKLSKRQYVDALMERGVSPQTALELASAVGKSLREQAQEARTKAVAQAVARLNPKKTPDPVKQSKFVKAVLYGLDNGILDSQVVKEAYSEAFEIHGISTERLEQLGKLFQKIEKIKDGMTRETLTAQANQVLNMLAPGADVWSFLLDAYRGSVLGGFGTILQQFTGLSRLLNPFQTAQQTLMRLGGVKAALNPVALARIYASILKESIKSTSMVRAGWEGAFSGDTRGIGTSPTSLATVSPSEMKYGMMGVRELGKYRSKLPKALKYLVYPAYWSTKSFSFIRGAEAFTGTMDKNLEFRYLASKHLIEKEKMSPQQAWVKAGDMLGEKNSAEWSKATEQAKKEVKDGLISSHAVKSRATEIMQDHLDEYWHLNALNRHREMSAWLNFKADPLTALGTGAYKLYKGAGKRFKPADFVFLFGKFFINNVERQFYNSFLGLPFAAALHTDENAGYMDERQKRIKAIFGTLAQYRDYRIGASISGVTSQFAAAMMTMIGAGLLKWLSDGEDEEDNAPYFYISGQPPSYDFAKQKQMESNAWWRPDTVFIRIPGTDTPFAFNYIQSAPDLAANLRMVGNITDRFMFGDLLNTELDKRTGKKVTKDIGQQVGENVMSAAFSPFDRSTYSAFGDAIDDIMKGEWKKFAKLLSRPVGETVAAVTPGLGGPIARDINKLTKGDPPLSAKDAKQAFMSGIPYMEQLGKLTDNPTLTGIPMIGPMGTSVTPFSFFSMLTRSQEATPQVKRAVSLLNDLGVVKQGPREEFIGGEVVELSLNGSKVLLNLEQRAEVQEDIGKRFAASLNEDSTRRKLLKAKEKGDDKEVKRLVDEQAKKSREAVLRKWRGKVQVQESGSDD